MPIDWDLYRKNAGLDTVTGSIDWDLYRKNAGLEPEQPEEPPLFQPSRPLDIVSEPPTPFAVAESTAVPQVATVPGGPEATRVFSPGQTEDIVSVDRGNGPVVFRRTPVEEKPIAVSPRIESVPSAAGSYSSPVRPKQESTKLRPLSQGEKADFTRRFSEWVADPTPSIPFIGGAVQLADLADIAVSARKIQKNEDSEADVVKVKDWIDRNSQETDWTYDALDTILTMPAFAGELGATFGAYTGVRRGAERAAVATLKRLLNKETKDIVERKALRYGYQALGAVAATAVQTPIARPFSVATDVVQSMMPEVQLTEDEKVIVGEPEEKNLAVAMAKGLGREWVQVFSERTGPAFKIGGNAARNALIKTGILKAIEKKGIEPAAFKLFAKRVGWDGVIAEMAEERTADVLNAALNLNRMSTRQDDDGVWRTYMGDRVLGEGISEEEAKKEAETVTGVWKQMIPSGRQLLTEAVAFSVPGMAATIAKRRMEPKPVTDQTKEPTVAEPTVPVTDQTKAEVVKEEASAEEIAKLRSDAVEAGITEAAADALVRRAEQGLPEYQQVRQTVDQRLLEREKVASPVEPPVSTTVEKPTTTETPPIVEPEAPVVAEDDLKRLWNDAVAAGYTEAAADATVDRAKRSQQDFMDVRAAVDARAKKIEPPKELATTETKVEGLPPEVVEPVVDPKKLANAKRTVAKQKSVAAVEQTVEKLRARGDVPMAEIEAEAEAAKNRLNAGKPSIVDVFKKDIDAQTDNVSIDESIRTSKNAPGATQQDLDEIESYGQRKKDQNAATAIKDGTDKNKTLGITTDSEGNIRVQAPGFASQSLPLNDLSDQEKRSIQIALNDQEIAETNEEKQEARKALQSVLIEPAKRAVAIHLQPEQLPAPVVKNKTAKAKLSQPVREVPKAPVRQSWKAFLAAKGITETVDQRHPRYLELLKEFRGHPAVVKPVTVEPVAEPAVIVEPVVVEPKTTSGGIPIDIGLTQNRIPKLISQIKQKPGKSATAQADRSRVLYGELRRHIEDLRANNGLDQKTVDRISNSGVYDNESLAKYLPEAVITPAAKPAAKPAAVEPVVGPEAGKKVEPLNIGDELTLSPEKIPSVLADQQTDENNIRYEIYNAKQGKDQRAVIRTWDVDSGKLINITVYPTFDHASKVYGETLAKVGLNPAGVAKSRQPAAAAEEAAPTGAAMTAGSGGLADVNRIFTNLPNAVPEQAPSGRWFYGGGKVPVALNYRRIDDNPLTRADAESIQRHGPGEPGKRFNRLTWGTEKEALDAARSLAIEGDHYVFKHIEPQVETTGKPPEIDLSDLSEKTSSWVRRVRTAVIQARDAWDVDNQVSLFSKANDIDDRRKEQMVAVGEWTKKQLIQPELPAKESPAEQQIREILAVAKVNDPAEFEAELRAMPASLLQRQHEHWVGNQAEPEKSKGHVAFFTGTDGSQYELYKQDNGELYRAPVSNVIDLDTGNRIGRFEATKAQADKAAQQIIKPFTMESDQAKEEPKKPEFVDQELPGMGKRVVPTGTIKAEGAGLEGTPLQGAVEADKVAEAEKGQQSLLGPQAKRRGGRLILAGEITETQQEELRGAGFVFDNKSNEWHGKANDVALPVWRKVGNVPEAPRNPRQENMPKRMSLWQAIRWGGGLKDAELDRIRSFGKPIDTPTFKKLISQLGGGRQSIEELMAENWNNDIGTVFRAAGIESVDDWKGFVAAASDFTQLRNKHALALTEDEEFIKKAEDHYRQQAQYPEGEVDESGQLRGPGGRVLFAYAGENALNKPEGLPEAQGMESAGRDREQIWQDTGWWRGPDGKWRFEIDDSDVAFPTEEVDGKTLEPRGTRMGALKDLIVAPKIFSAYPELGNVQANIRIMPGTETSGAFNEKNGEIAVKAPDLENAKSALVHELQHSIQQYEGFDLGSNLKGRTQAEYQAVPGEVESRAVQQRLTMTPEQKVAEAPWTTMERMLAEEGTTPAPAMTREPAVVSLDKNTPMPQAPPTGPQTVSEVLADPSMKHLDDRAVLIEDHTQYPQNLQDAARKNKNADLSQVRAIYDPATRRVYINKALLTTPVSLRLTLVHEFAIHDGLRVAMGDEAYSEMTRQLWNGLTERERQRLRDQHPITAEAETSGEAGDEWLGYEAERVWQKYQNGEQDPFWHWVAAKIRPYIRRHFKADLRYTDAEIADLIRLGERATRQPTEAAGGERLATTAVTDTPAFKRWFGSSKVVDAEGKPLRVFHAGEFDETVDGVPVVGPDGFHFGTKGAADSRQSGKVVDDSIRNMVVDQDGDTGRWFWSSSGIDSFDLDENGFDSEEDARRDGEQVLSEQEYDGEEMPVTQAYMSIKNPMRVRDQKGSWESVIRDAKKKGHDGLVYVNQFEDKGSISWVAFYPEQIKSATGNRGTFSAESPDIRMAVGKEPEAHGDVAFSAADRQQRPRWRKPRVDKVERARATLGEAVTATTIEDTHPNERGWITKESLVKQAKAQNEAVWDQIVSAQAEEDGVSVKEARKQLQPDKHALLVESGDYRSWHDYVPEGYISFKWRDGKTYVGEPLERPIETRVGIFVRAAQRFVQDIYSEVGKAQKDVQDVYGPIPDDANAYEKANLEYSKAGEERKLFRKETAEPLIRELINNGYTADEFGRYLTARHKEEREAWIAEKFPERAAEGKGIGMSQEEADELLKRFNGTPMEALADRFYKEITQPTLKLLADNGMITPESFEELSTRWKYYVPEKGDAVSPETPRTGTRFMGREFKQAKGRSSMAFNPFLQALADREMAYQRIANAEVRRAFLNFVLDNPSKGWRAERKTSIPLYNAKGEVALYQSNLKYEDNQIDVPVDGKTWVITIEDQAIADGIKRLKMWHWNTDGTNSVVKKGLDALTFYMNFRRATAISYSPEFIFMSNPQRDVQTAMANLTAEQKMSMAAKTLEYAPKAFFGIYGELRGEKPSEMGEWYRDYLNQGAAVNWTINEDGIQQLERLEKLVRREFGKGGFNATMKGLNYLGEYADNINTAVENALRLGSYRAAVESGMTKQKAAMLAKNLTVNFERKGKFGPTLTRLYLFANASIQSSARFFTLWSDPRTRKRAAAICGSMMAAQLFASMWNRMVDPDDWNDMDDGVKDAHWLIRLPFVKDEESRLPKYVSIKLPWSWNVPIVAANVSEELFFGDHDGLRAVRRMVGSTIDSFNPLGGNTWSQMVSPTLFDPIVQLAENKDAFGRPLKPESIGIQTKPNSEMYFKSVRPYSRELTNALNKWGGGNEGYSSGFWTDWSPETVDFLVDEVGGGAAKFLANAASTGEAILKTGPQVELGNVPFARQLGKNPYGFVPMRLAKQLYKEHGNNLMDPTEEARFHEAVNRSVKRGVMTQDDADKLNVQVANTQSKLRAALSPTGYDPEMGINEGRLEIIREQAREIAFNKLGDSTEASKHRQNMIKLVRQFGGMEKIKSQLTPKEKQGWSGQVNEHITDEIKKQRQYDTVVEAYATAKYFAKRDPAKAAAAMAAGHKLIQEFGGSDKYFAPLRGRINWKKDLYKKEVELSRNK